MRALRQAEAAFLGSYFGTALDLRPIRLGRSPGARSWSPLGNLIQLSRGLFTPSGEVDLGRPEAAAVFAHEAIHVWQRQHGRAVTREGAYLQCLYTLGLRDPYLYRAHAHPRDLVSEFVLGSIEQQGRIFQDYVFCERTGRDIARFAAVAVWVRESGVRESSARH